MLRLWLLLTAVLAVLARQSFDISSCNVMTVNMHSQAEVEFRAQLSGWSEDQVAVLGFSPFDGTFSDCQFVAWGTSLPAEFLAGSEANMLERMGGSGMLGLVGILPLEKLSQCLEDEIAGTLYLAILDVDSVVNKTFTPISRTWHEFSLDTAANTASVSPMPWMLRLETVRNFWISESESHLSVKTRIESSEYLLRIEEPEVIEVSGLGRGTVSVSALSDCDETITTDYLGNCEQAWFLSADNLPSEASGTVSIRAKIADRMGNLDSELSIPVTIHVNYDFVHGSESVETASMLFRDADAKLPYISTSLDADSLEDGQVVSVALGSTARDQQEMPALRAARICTSESVDLVSEDGCTACGCSTPNVDDMIVEMLFDFDDDTYNDRFTPMNVDANAFSFAIRKLGESKHIIEVEYYRETERRSLLGFEWDESEGSRHGAWVNCGNGRRWDAAHHNCVYPGHAWWWWVLGFFVLFCLITMCCGAWYYVGGHGYSSLSGWGGDTQQQATATSNTQITHVHQGSRSESDEAPSQPLHRYAMVPKVAPPGVIYYGKQALTKRQ